MPLTFLSYMRIIKQLIIACFNGEGKHREETCISKISIKMFSMICEVYQPPLGQRGGLWPKPSHNEKRPVPSSGTVYKQR